MKLGALRGQIFKHNGMWTTCLDRRATPTSQAMAAIDSVDYWWIQLKSYQIEWEAASNIYVNSLDPHTLGKS